MHFHIRTTTKNDAFETARVHVNSWRSAYRNIIPDDFLSNLSVEKTAERFVSDYDLYMGKSFYYVAVNDNHIIGNLVLFKCRDDDKPLAGEIGAIYLLEEFWDYGYGRLMMNYAIDTLKSMDFLEIIIWVLEENKRARMFYEKFGFVADGTAKKINIGKELIEIRYVLDIRK
jgi:GNAT superfamily N-acetyltransferase